jgi:hypothetical protein
MPDAQSPVRLSSGYAVHATRLSLDRRVWTTCGRIVHAGDDFLSADAEVTCSECKRVLAAIPLCACPLSEQDPMPYLLDLDQGRVSLTCQTCHRPVPGDVLSMLDTALEIPVTVDWEGHATTGREDPTEYDLRGKVRPA